MEHTTPGDVLDNLVAAVLAVHTATAPIRRSPRESALKTRCKDAVRQLALAAGDVRLAASVGALPVNRVNAETAVSAVLGAARAVGLPQADLARIFNDVAEGA